MMQKFFLLILPVLLLACRSDSPETTNSDPQTPISPAEQLKAAAVDESDIYGRLQLTVAVLQEEYTRSESAMPGLKNVNISIDADCFLLIANQAVGETTTRANLRDLDPRGFSLIPDLNPGDFPGLRVRAREGATADELVIYLVDRPAIERITPYLLQAINICNE